MRLSSRIRSLVLLIAAGSFAAGLSSQASDFHSVRTVGLGGAGHAGPTVNDAIVLNPSYGSLLKSYSMAFNYLWYKETDFSGRQLNVSLQDGMSELFQAGVSYTQRGDANLLHLGASKAVVERVGVGLGGKMIFPKDGSRKLIRDATLSTSGIPTDWLQLVGVVDNLFQSDEGKERGFYREFILGTKVNVQGIVLLYFDPHYTPNLPSGDTYGHELGAEFVLGSDFFLRLGMFRNSAVPMLAGARGRGFGFGLGWIGPRTSLDYGIQRVLEPVGATSHIVGLSVYF